MFKRLSYRLGESGPKIPKQVFTEFYFSITILFTFAIRITCASHLPDAIVLLSVESFDQGRESIVNHVWRNDPLLRILILRDS